MANCHNCERLAICHWANPEEIICSSFKPKPITNADRIRNMSDEELANELSGQCPAIFGGHRMSGEGCMGFDSCQACWLDWLKQEVSTNGN